MILKPLDMSTDPAGDAGIQEAAANSAFVQGMLDLNLKPHDPKQTLYKYTTVETAVKVLETSSFRFASPATFNDPFEMHVGSLDYRIKIKDLRESFYRHSRSIKPTISKAELETAFNRISVENMKKALKKSHEQHRKEVSLLCLSERNDSTLMWSHYAAKHKGVCIGIKMPRIVEALHLVTLHVNYATEVKPVRLVFADEFEKAYALLYWACTKSKTWDYEKEVRAFITNRDFLRENNSEYLDVGFDPFFFTEIHYGVATPQEDIDKIEKIIAEKQYPIEKRSKMKINDGTFDLIPIKL